MLGEVKEIDRMAAFDYAVTARGVYFIMPGSLGAPASIGYIDHMLLYVQLDQQAREQMLVGSGKRRGYH